MPLADLKRFGNFEISSNCTWIIFGTCLNICSYCLRSIFTKFFTCPGHVLRYLALVSELFLKFWSVLDMSLTGFDRLDAWPSGWREWRRQWKKRRGDAAMPALVTCQNMRSWWSCEVDGVDAALTTIEIASWQQRALYFHSRSDAIARISAEASIELEDAMEEIAMLKVGIWRWKHPFDVSHWRSFLRRHLSASSCCEGYFLFQLWVWKRTMEPLEKRWIPLFIVCCYNALKASGRSKANW